MFYKTQNVFEKMIVFVALFAMGLEAMPTPAKTPEDITPDAAEAYLKRFGYMQNRGESENSGIASLTSPIQTMPEALTLFQYMAGIPQTGILDQETRIWMAKPRCGVMDFAGAPNSTHGRNKRYVHGDGVWSTNRLRYSFTAAPRENLVTRFYDIAKAAFKHWSDVTPLTFTEVWSPAPADIEILWGTFEHGDGYPFDGPGGLLAHANYPMWGGDVHFDDDEHYTENSYYGTNLLQVAVHEFGHALGLAHSSIPGSVMAAFYPGFNPNFRITKDDIDGIQSLYGKPDYYPPEPPTKKKKVPTATLR